MTTLRVKAGNTRVLRVTPPGDRVVRITNKVTRMVRVVARGLRGEKGEQGDPGFSGDAYYEHIQSIPAAVWTITHALDKEFPSVTVINSSKDVVIGDVQYVNATSLTVTFGGGFSGRAVLN